MDVAAAFVDGLAGRLGPTLLVGCRALGLAWTAPGWGTSGLPPRIRFGLVLMLTFLVAPLVTDSAPARGVVGGVKAAGAEVVVGAMLGLSAALVVAAARGAGEIVGVQAGLSAASLLDPDAGEELTPLGHIYGLTALGLFLALDGPLALVGAWVESYRAVPLGGWSVTDETVAQAFGRVGWAAALSLQAAAPAAVALVLAGLALGLVTRAAGATPLANFSLSLRSLMGLGVALVGLATLAATLLRAWDEVIP